MSARYLGIHGTLTLYFNLSKLRQCIDEWYNYISQRLQYKLKKVWVYIMRINESMSILMKHHMIIGHWCIPLTDVRRSTDNDDELQGTWVQTEKCEINVLKSNTCRIKQSGVIFVYPLSFARNPTTNDYNIHGTHWGSYIHFLDDDLTSIGIDPSEGVN